MIGPNLFFIVFHIFFALSGLYKFLNDFQYSFKSQSCNYYDFMTVASKFSNLNSYIASRTYSSSKLKFLGIRGGSSSITDAETSTSLIVVEDSSSSQPATDQTIVYPPQDQTSYQAFSEINEKSYLFSREDVTSRLQVSPAYGLSTDEANYRLSIFGTNEIISKSKDSLLKLIWEQFEDKLVQTLISVAAFSSILAFFENDYSAFTEPAVILACLIINAFVGVLHARNAEGSLEALKSLQPSIACVLRDGQWLSNYPSKQLVIGDIIQLRAGDKIPADARVIELMTSTLSVDESSLTGESMPVQKLADMIDASMVKNNHVALASRFNMIHTGCVCYCVWLHLYTLNIYIFILLFYAFYFS